MQKYRTEAWSRRFYSIRYHKIAPAGSYSGSHSLCLELAGGVWAVGNDTSTIWVLRGPYTDPRFPQMLLETETIFSKRPDFILLSGEPLYLLTGALSCQSSLKLVMDGSNRSWFRDRMHTVQAGIYDTERLGAYTKRW
jgi:hypothetical protein